MRVLVACEFTGTVRDAFLKRGHDAWSCDLLPTEVPGPHLQCDVLGVLSQDWDLLIAHPPCTYLARSGIHWNASRPNRDLFTKAALKFAVALLDCSVPRIAVENPIGVLSTAVRKPEQVIQPHQFGHDARKTTGLWLKNLPKLQFTKLIPPRLVCCGAVFEGRCPTCFGFFKPKRRWANQSDAGNELTPASKYRSMDRSRTYQGIADAMAEQWG